MSTTGIAIMKYTRYSVTFRYNGVVYHKLLPCIYHDLLETNPSFIKWVLSTASIPARKQAAVEIRESGTLSPDTRDVMKKAYEEWLYSNGKDEQTHCDFLSYICNDIQQSVLDVLNELPSYEKESKDMLKYNEVTEQKEVKTQKLDVYKSMKSMLYEVYHRMSSNEKEIFIKNILHDVINYGQLISLFDSIYRNMVEKEIYGCVLTEELRDSFIAIKEELEAKQKLI